MCATASYPLEPSSFIGTILAHWHQSECPRELGCGLTGCRLAAASAGDTCQNTHDLAREAVGWNALWQPPLCPRASRPQDCGSNWKTRSSWSQRQAFAMRAAHATASSREGSSSTVKPPSSGGAQGYPPSAMAPSGETSAGETPSSMPPPKT